MKYFKNLVKPYLVWSFIMIVIPLFMIFMYAVTSSGNSLLNISFTLDNFAKIADPVWISVFVNSIRLGTITVFICLVFGYAFALLISRFSERVQNILILVVTVPTWINMLIRTYAWISILSPNGIINTLLTKIGMGPLDIMYNDFSVILGLVCNFMPFMIIPIHTCISKMDKSLIEASYDLGATPLQTFKRVIFKLSLPGVVNGVIMVFLLSISTFVIPKLLGGGQYMLIGNLIENQFISVGDWNFGSAISLILAAIILIVIRLMKKIDPDEAKEGRL